MKISMLLKMKAQKSIVKLLIKKINKWNWLLKKFRRETIQNNNQQQMLQRA